MHPPRAPEVDPPLTGTGTASDGWFAHDLDALLPQVAQRSVEIIHVEGDVVSADVAVARLRRSAICGFVLEDLEIGSERTAVEPQFADDGAGVHSEVSRHPVVVSFEWALRVDTFAADHIHEEVLGLIDVRHGEADMLGAAQSRNS